MKLEILHVPDCPNAAVLAARISEIGPQDAERLDMTGSPTLLAVGADPFARPGRSLPSRAASTTTSTAGRTRAIAQPAPGSPPSHRSWRPVLTLSFKTCRYQGACWPTQRAHSAKQSGRMASRVGPRC
jgi:hypothetical protein